jgi:Carboxypeptidase regulatory-like domain/TonB-dependent Receptor Plug Domain
MTLAVRKFAFATVLFIIACYGSVAFSQTNSTGALQVTVTDPSGEAIPGATVTLVSVATGQARTAKTSADGSYTFTLVPPGSYNVTISATGFKTLVVPSATVVVTQTQILSQKLELGAQRQKVIVSALPPALQTQSVTMGGVVTDQTIEALPLSTRNYQQILTLSAGVGASVTDATAIGRQSPFLFVNGLSSNANNMLEDGVQITSFPNGVSDEASGFYGEMAVPNPDAVQEFKVQTGQFDAEYGEYAGANVDVVTKSGTNNFHGSLFEYFRNTVLDANNFFSNRAGLPRGKLNQNQFGGSLGGPMKENKLFFFISYQGTRQINGVTDLGYSVVSLPEQLTQITPSVRANAASLRSALGTAFCPQNNVSGTSLGPGYIYTQTLNGGATAASPLGTIPQDQVACDGSNINPVVVNLMQAKNPDGTYIIPTLLPSQLVSTKATVLGEPNTTVLTGEVPVSIPATYREDQAVGNLDYIINSKETLSTRYFYSYAPFNEPFPGSGLGLEEPEGGGQIVTAGNNLALIRLTSLLSSNMVNQAQFSYYYSRADNVATDPITPSAEGISLSPSWDNVMPVINTGVFTFGGSVVSGSREPQNYWEWSDQVSWTHGRQNVNFGYDQQRLSMLNDVTFPDRGSVNFPDWADFLLATSAANNHTLFSNIYSASIAATPVGGAKNQLRDNFGSAYIEDNVKVTPSLTANLGLRWEYEGLEYDALGDAIEPWVSLLKSDPIPPTTGTFIGYTAASNYAANPANPPLPAGVFVRPVKTLSENNAPWDNFAPRLGLAWQPFGTGRGFVLRAGGGVFYNPILGNMFQTITNSTPPIAISADYAGATEVNGTFQTPVTTLPTLGWAEGARYPTAAAALAAGGLASEASLSYAELSQHVVTPTVYSWELDAQYALKPTWIVDLAYVGNRGEHLLAFGSDRDNDPVLAVPGVPGINNTTPAMAGVNCANITVGCITTNTYANAPERVPIVGMAPTLSDQGTFGDSEYESLQAQIRKTFGHGLQFTAAYTFGRNLTDVSGDELGGAINYNYPPDTAAHRSNSDFNRPQRLVLQYSYDLPNYQSGDAFLNHALSGWEISGITTIQSGLYMTFTDANGGGAYGLPTSGAELCPGMTAANIITPGSVESRLNDYFNTSAFASGADATNPACPFPLAPNNAGDPKATLFGNINRAILRGPDQNNWDMSITKETRVPGWSREGANVEFRTDFFNAFNHPQFNNPETAVNFPAIFGVISSTSTGPRVIQFALRYQF